MRIKKLLTLCLTLLCMSSYAQNEGKENSTEQDIVLPEGMQAQEIDSLIKEWNTRHFLSFDENCETTGENPEFPEEEYIRKMSRLPNIIEMTYNDVVRKFIDQYSGRLRRTVSIMLGAGNFYNPIFEEALESYQIPLELKYLPIIESALNPNAVSRAGAVGLWQFMIGTAKQYGLEVNSLIDERRDPIKSSFAAAHYMRDLYEIFGDWHLVLACYNCGPGNINKAIKRAGGVKNYWAISSYLPKETQGYVPAFIAATYIMNYYCDHNICPVNTTLPQGTDTIVLSRDIAMERIEKVCGIEEEELKALNPQYRTNLIPGETHPCTLRMPAEKISAFLEAGDTIYSSRSEAMKASRKAAPVQQEEVAKSTGGKAAKGGKTVKVRSGDSLGAIARRNHTTVANIKRLNGLRNDNIRAGQSLRVR